MSRHDAAGGTADLIEHYFEQGWTDGLPVTPPTPELVAAMVTALGGEPSHLEARIPPRWGNLTREVLAINLVLAGCRPVYAPVVRAALLALTSSHFNLHGVQATTHMAAPLVVVNGPVRGEIGLNAGANVFGSGCRANATIGRAIRLVLLNVGGAWPGDLDKSTLGHPGKYTFCIAENEEASPWAPYHVEHGYAPGDSTVFCIAAEGPHSVTNHVANDPEGILDSIASAMSTIAHNNAVSSGSCAVVIGPEHAATIAGKGWTRQEARRYLWEAARNTWGRRELRRPLRQDIQPQSAAMVPARAGRAHSGRPRGRRHPPVRRRRRSRTLLRLSPRVGPHDVAGAALPRRPPARRRGRLRRRHLRAVGGLVYPPAMAPTIRYGSTPATTGSGRGVSGGSCDRSCSQAKNRMYGRRRCVA